jgi:hypothetical protein
MPDDRLKIFWNMVVLFLLSYTATIVPYRTAFEDTPPTFFFYFDILVDILFFMDLFVNMFSAIEKGENNFETRFHRIFFAYIRGWFVLDVMAVLPF